MGFNRTQIDAFATRFTAGRLEFDHINIKHGEAGEATLTASFSEPGKPALHTDMTYSELLSATHEVAFRQADARVMEQLHDILEQMQEQAYPHKLEPVSVRGTVTGKHSATFTESHEGAPDTKVEMTELELVSALAETRKYGVPIPALEDAYHALQTLPKDKAATLKVAAKAERNESDPPTASGIRFTLAGHPNPPGKSRI